MEANPMKAALKSPAYLVRNPYSFCFRMIVPKDLRKFVGKTELRYTLRTGNLRDAKHKAKLLAGQVQLIFRCLRKEHQALGKLSDDQIKQLVHQYIKNAVQWWDKNFYEEFDEEVYPPPFTDARGFHGHLKSLEYFRDDLIDCLNLGDFSYKNELPEIFADLFKKPPEQMSLITQAVDQNPADQDGHLLSEVIQRFVAENEKDNWSKKSKGEYKSSLNLFLEFMGDVPVKSISRR
jgi:hypothetical protein